MYGAIFFSIKCLSRHSGQAGRWSKMARIKSRKVPEEAFLRPDSESGGVLLFLRLEAPPSPTPSYVAWLVPQPASRYRTRKCAAPWICPGSSGSCFGPLRLHVKLLQGRLLICLVRIPCGDRPPLAAAAAGVLLRRPSS